ncbi:ligand of Numb protein X 2-like isoform X2 [Periplaneta americana]|uniref:ligand of Numb protein X 2-like isoform X2 n=1 Tax=Periplaneta americana TaxID=6978 RepID=UPI0037E7ACC4
MEKGRRSGSAACRTCGQAHAAHEPHVYDYVEEVDEDLTCHICLQPFVMPLDIPCGHTFCSACLNNYLRVQQLCPIDRKPLTAHICSPSSIVLRKLLEKLSVRCPNRNGCDKILQRGDLQDHLNLRCPAASVAWSMKSPRCAASKVPSSPTKSKGITRLPVLEGEISHIEIPRLATNLGITIVGGADTALACQALRKMSPVLRLGVYRERIEAYSARSSAHYVEEVHTVNLERQTNQQLGVRLSGWWMEQGIFILEIIPGSPAAKSGQLEPYDRILSVNGEDVANCRLDQASRLIQTNEKVTLVVARKRLNRNLQNKDSHSLPVCHGRTKSAPEALGSTTITVGTDVQSQATDSIKNINIDPTSQSQTWQAKLQQISPDRNISNVTKTLCLERSHSHSCDSLQKMEGKTCQQLPSPPCIRRASREVAVDDMAVNIKRNLHIEGIQLQQKCVTINKEPNESLGMRIGGGLGSNEGDIPIYIANIHPQGCVGKTQQIWKGDILLNVNGTSLMGLTHTQAVATLKATVESTQVSLGVLEGPETSLGSLNFIPSWLYWQRLPRCLQFPKTVILHRSPGASLGFSIVGGEDPVRGPEAIHILFVVQDSPAAKHGKLRCGDRLLAVDGHSLENVKHSTAVAMLKQTGSRVTLEVVSWLGTEL